jgi:hypothetical protein
LGEGLVEATAITYRSVALGARRAAAGEEFLLLSDPIGKFLPAFVRIQVGVVFGEGFTLTAPATPITSRTSCATIRLDL